MAEQLLMRILTMSLTASAVILAVLLLRLCLKKAPRIFSYCLWAAVLFRLLCPVSFTAAFSPFSMLKAPANPQDRLNMRTDIPPFGTNKALEPSEQTEKTAAGTDSQAPADALPSKQAAPASSHHIEALTKAATFLWLSGMAVFLLANLVHLLRLKRHIKAAVWDRENIYLTNQLLTPFVIGIFRPKIYLPAHLRQDEKEYVLLHEQIHIRRKDPAIRLLSCLALCLHWFNPLVWVAFFLSGSDMEMSCDEAVIRQMGSGVKKPYADSLLAIAAGTGINALNGGLLTFGKGDTKNRIKHILHYKKTTSVLLAGAALVCTAAVVILLADPAPASGLEQEQPKQNGTFYKISVRSMNEKKRQINNFVGYEPFPLSDNAPLALADDCRFFVNHSMNSIDYQEQPFPVFASLIRLGGEYLDKNCSVLLEDQKVSEIYMESAWNHNGISPYVSLPDSGQYDSLIQAEGEAAFLKNYTLVSAQKADIADCKGTETVETYIQNGKDAENGFVLFKKDDGSLLFSQEANTSRAGWMNIYTGSIDKHPFILNVHVEDRWNYGTFSYQAFHLDETGTPVLAASSLFDFHLAKGSRHVYDDALFSRWIQPLETYLKHSRLVLSSQDGMLRTEPVSDADKYQYQTLSLKERAEEINANDNSLIRYNDCWYSKSALKKETVDWLLWYQSLTEQERLSVSSVAPELIEAKSLMGAATEDAALE